MSVEDRCAVNSGVNRPWCDASPLPVPLPREVFDRRANACRICVWKDVLVAPTTRTEDSTSSVLDANDKATSTLSNMDATLPTISSRTVFLLAVVTVGPLVTERFEALVEDSGSEETEGSVVGGDDVFDVPGSTSFDFNDLVFRCRCCCCCCSSRNSRDSMNTSRAVCVVLRASRIASPAHPDGAQSESSGFRG